MGFLIFSLQVPNQPIHFAAEQPPRGRSEDAIIAYTWNHFLNTPTEPEWLLRLPMTKVRWEYLFNKQLSTPPRHLTYIFHIIDS